MAIEVLFRGTPPSEYKYLHECSVCSSNFTYQKSDTQPGAYDGPPGAYDTITCPVCKEARAVEYKRVPQASAAAHWRD